MMFITGKVWWDEEHISNDAGRFSTLANFASREIKKADDASMLHAAIKVDVDDLNKQLSNYETPELHPDSPDIKIIAGIKEELTGSISKLDQVILNTEGNKISEELPQALNQVAVQWRELQNTTYQHSTTNKINRVLFDGLFVSLSAAMFSLLGFYIAAAAYRAFRIKSVESSLMLVAAFLVMLGQIPFGIWVWDKFPEIRLWLLSTPNTAAFRAITIGAKIAGLVMALRMWFSIESETFEEERL